MNMLTRLRVALADLTGRGEYGQFPDRYRCIFIHVPKVAGTSIAMTLFGRKSRHVPWFVYQQANPTKFAEYFKFAFVRNPLDRLVSSYLFLREGGMNEADAAWSQQHLQGFTDFRQFVHEWVNEERVWSWVHFRPQHHFLCDDSGKNMVDFLGKYESLEADFVYVASHLGLSTDLQSINRTERHGFDAYYDSEMRSIVERAYARDFELFGY